MERGDLVQSRDNHAMGIVLSLRESDTEVMWGDGLRELVDANGLVVVRFKPGATIPACFVEMVDAYCASRGFD